MTSSTRRIVFLFSAAVMGAQLALALGGLASFGSNVSDYASLLNRRAPQERHAQNVVTAVAYDYRGLDTVMEELILLTAVSGVALLLRAQRGEVEEWPDDDLPGREVPGTSSAVQAVSRLLAALGALFGLYFALHAHLSPGGGFQGGVTIASALLLVYLAGDIEAFRHLAPEVCLDLVESVGALALVAVGLAGLFLSGSFLANVLPLGRTGDLLSGGMLLPLNVVICLMVASGLVLLLSEFLHQALILRNRRSVLHEEEESE